MLLLAFLAVRHFVTTSRPLSRGKPGLLAAAGLLLLLAQALKALGWARLFTNRERPSPLALAAGNGGAALIGVVLPGRFDDAMRISVVRRYPGCPAGLRAISLSLVMLGLIGSAALAPLAAVAVAFPGAGIAARAALAVVARSRDRGRRRERSEAMAVLDKLRKVGNYVRKGWSSSDPDSGSASTTSTSSCCITRCRATSTGRSLRTRRPSRCWRTGAPARSASPTSARSSSRAC